MKDASEIYVQKKRKVRGVGSRLGTKSEVKEINWLKGDRLFGKKKKMNKKKFEIF